MKAVYKYGLEKQPNFEELLDYVQNNNDKIQYPSRVFLNIYNDPIYQGILDASRIQEERYERQVQRQNEYRRDPRNVAPYQFERRAPQLALPDDPVPAGPLANPWLPNALPAPPLLDQTVAVNDPQATGILREGVQVPDRGSVFKVEPVRVNPQRKESALAPYARAERSSPGVPQFYIGEDEDSGNASSSWMPLPTPEVPAQPPNPVSAGEQPTRLRRIGRAAATGARYAGKALYGTANLGMSAVDAMLDPDGVVPEILGGGAALMAGAGGLMAGAGTLLAGGGLAVADTVMRDRDRPPDALSQGMEDAAYRDGRAPRPSLNDLETVNARSKRGYVPAQRSPSPARE